jgi:hypothetical protein
MPHGRHINNELDLELELIQTQMAQKPMQLRKIYEKKRLLSRWQKSSTWGLGLHSRQASRLSALESQH